MVVVSLVQQYQVYKDEVLKFAPLTVRALSARPPENAVRINRPLFAEYINSQSKVCCTLPCYVARVKLFSDDVSRRRCRSCRICCDGTRKALWSISTASRASLSICYRPARAKACSTAKYTQITHRLFSIMSYISLCFNVRESLATLRHILQIELVALVGGYADGAAG